MPQTWRTVRIFISSTFRDFHAERDYLVKVVFPELRERCRKRQLHLIDVDLRWGVTEEEAEQGKVLEIILDEIDRSRPFFVALLGERYGSVPDKIPEDTKFTYQWLQDYPNHSLTALEIIHGVLHKPDLAKRSFFYFRNPKFILEIPKNKQADFMAENPESANKLKGLKDKIRTSDRPVMENYSCRWHKKKMQLVGLDVFGQQVLEDLWKAVCKEYPELPLEVDPLILGRQMHEAFVEERSRLYIGRTKQATRLTKYVQGTDRRPVFISGESGCGKSAFLASWYRRYTDAYPDDFVLAYFVGASPDSTNHWRLLRNMCEEVRRKYNLKQELPEDDKKLPETLGILLASASRVKSRIIIILDALDQLSIQGGAHGLGWLLDYIPENVRLVLSSLEGDCLDVLRRCGAEEIPLPPLTIDEQRQIIQSILGEWRRKLDNRQMEKLLDHPGVKNPLYLRVALEELRLFGRFEQLTIRIDKLANDVPRLFDQVLERLEGDHGYKLVTEAFSLLGCSRYGLSEVEMLDLLSRKGEEPLSRALWVRLARSAKAYLVQRGEFFGFFHRQFADSVATRYLNVGNRQHQRLASYFEEALIERKLDEYPYQLQQAKQYQALAHALSDLDFFDYAYRHNRRYEWMSYWQSVSELFEPAFCYQEALELREKKEGMTENVAGLLNDVGLFLENMGMYISALPISKHAVEVYENIYGLNHHNVAVSLNNLGILYFKLGMQNEAAPLLKRALKIFKCVYGSNQPYVSSNHHYIANAHQNLGNVYSRRGKYKKALQHCEHALDIYERLFGPNHPSVANILVNISIIYWRQKMYNEAVPLSKRALGIHEHVHGKDHPDVAESLQQLANLYSAQGKYDEALSLYKRALKIHVKVFGRDHPDVATSLSNLGIFYWHQKKYNEALPCYKRALEIHERVHGKDHPDVAISLNNLADLYFDYGKYKEALPLLKRAISIAKAKLGPDHPHTKHIKKNLLYCQSQID